MHRSCLTLLVKYRMVIVLLIYQIFITNLQKWYHASNVYGVTVLPIVFTRSRSLTSIETAAQLHTSFEVYETPNTPWQLLYSSHRAYIVPLHVFLISSQFYLICSKLSSIFCESNFKFNVLFAITFSSVFLIFEYFYFYIKLHVSLPWALLCNSPPVHSYTLVGGFGNTVQVHPLDEDYYRSKEFKARVDRVMELNHQLCDIDKT